MNVSDLSGQRGTMLVCADDPDHGEWSATPGDYWWMAATDTFRCECGAELVEVRKVTMLEAV